MAKLTGAQLNWLRKLSGQTVHPKLLRPQTKKAVIRSLIDQGLITAEGWVPTEAGRRALEQGGSGK